QDQVKLALTPARVTDMKLVTRPDGTRILYVAVHPSDKAIAIGKGGKNIQKLRLILKRHFGVDSVIVA
ncbi:MAG: KH domain-containing protein, partial [Desulfurococcaceae archaeon]